MNRRYLAVYSALESVSHLLQFKILHITEISVLILADLTMLLAVNQKNHMLSCGLWRPNKRYHPKEKA